MMIYIYILRLPCSSLVEEFKITKTRELLQYTESEQPKVVAAGIQIRSGRKWSARREWQVAEERLRHKDILGSIAKGSAGLGFFLSTHTISAKGKERRHLILEEVREGIEEGRYCKMVGLSQQRAWTRWEDVEKKGLHGQIVGGRISTRFYSSLNRCMMYYRAQPTCTYGGR